jgi:hypothetical protein
MEWRIEQGARHESIETLDFPVPEGDQNDPQNIVYTVDANFHCTFGVLQPQPNYSG